MGRKTVWIFVGLAFLGLLVVASVGDVREVSRSPRPVPVDGPVSNGTITVTLFNRTTEVICAVYVAPAGDGEWGADLLDQEVVAPGERTDFALPPGTYDFRVDNCFDHPLVRERMEVTAPFDWIVLPPETVGGGHEGNR